MSLKHTLKHDTVIYKEIKDSNILVKWNFCYGFPLVIICECAYVYPYQISNKYEKIPLFFCFVLYSDLAICLRHSCGAPLHCQHVLSLCF